MGSLMYHPYHLIIEIVAVGFHFGPDTFSIRWYYDHDFFVLFPSKKSHDDYKVNVWPWTYKIFLFASWLHPCYWHTHRMDHSKWINHLVCLTALGHKPRAKDIYLNSAAAIASLACVSASWLFYWFSTVQILQWLSMPQNRIFLGLHFVVAKCKPLYISTTRLIFGAVYANSLLAT